VEHLGYTSALRDAPFLLRISTHLSAKPESGISSFFIFGITPVIRSQGYVIENQIGALCKELSQLAGLRRV
jgi:hypothetical protein